MSIIESCFLGLLQGLTEFLPVSSSGHLVVAETLLKYKASELLAFDLVLHMATLLAICIFYRRRLIELTYACLPPYSPAHSTPKTIADRQTLFAIGLSTCVTVVIGLAFKDQFEGVRDNLGVVGGSFLFTGLLLFSTLWSNPKTKDRDVHFPVNVWFFALIVGFMQGVAILPGVSRSGSTVCAALLLGLSRTRAVEYSFLLSIPAILMATIYETLFSDSMMGAVAFFPAACGFAIALFSGIVFLGLLVWIVSKGRLFAFSFYTIPLGVGVLIYYFMT